MSTKLSGRTVVHQRDAKYLRKVGADIIWRVRTGSWELAILGTVKGHGSTWTSG